MIKTLQISSILAVVLAVVLFVSSVVFGTAVEDEQIEEFLKSPSVKEQFAKMGSVAKKRSNSQSSPLVDKAEQFARILNPPKPKAPPKVVTKATKEPAIPTPKVAVKPKFRLFGTVVCGSDPTKSLALLDEPGKGSHMVRQGSVIMHLTIVEIKDGRIVVQDTTGTSEMVVEEGPALASVVPGPPMASVTGGRPPVSPAASKTRITAPPRSPASNGRRGPATSASIKSRLSNAENARLAALGDRLKAARDAKADSKIQRPESEGDDPAMALMKKMLADAEKEKAAAAAAMKDPNRSESPSTPPVPPSRRR